LIPADIRCHLPQIHALQRHISVSHHLLSAYQRTFVRVLRMQLGQRAAPGGFEVRFELDCGAG